MVSRGPGRSTHVPLVVATVRCVVAMAAGAILVPAGLAAQSDGEPPRARPYRVSRLSGEIRVDGRLAPGEWEAATAVPLEYEWAPGDNVEPPVRTIAFVTYDDRSIYVAFRCADPDPTAIRAHLMDRDAVDTLIQDDHVSLVLDSFNDERRAFQFRVNPLGVQADAIFSQVEFVEDFSWDIIWASAGQITVDGYEIELAIPLNQIRFPAGGRERTWGMEFGRSYPRSVRHRISANPRDRNQRCVLCQVNKVTGFAGLRPGLNVELDPTFTAARTDTAPSPGAALESGEADPELGVTGRWGVTSGLTFNGTINPDFSQVEADVAQLAVNERFALFFPEKRPFFLEGVDFFTTPLQAVFTRTVVDPRWGAKLAGKQGRNVVGIFVTEDRVNSLVLPANQGSESVLLDDNVTATVLRYRRDVGQGSTLGALYAGREALGYHNRVGGIDAFVPLSAVDELRVQYLWSETRDTDEVGQITGRGTAAFAGHAARVNYQRNSRNWYVEGEYDDLDQSFRADSGFIPRVDVRRGYGGFYRFFWGERDDWYTRVQVGGTYQIVGDQDGTLTDESVAARGFVLGPLQSVMGAFYSRRKERFAGTLYEGLDSVLVQLEAQPSGAAKLGFIGRVGESIDYTNDRPSLVRQAEPAIELKIGRRVNARLSHTLQQLLYEGSQVYMANLTEARLYYHFSVRSFVRGILQFRDLNRDPSLYVAPVRRDARSVFTQLLFSYKLNPQTVVFLGYSDNQAGVDDADLDHVDRTFFVKLGYAWVR